jgi:hypothetical protein
LLGIGEFLVAARMIIGNRTGSFPAIRAARLPMVSALRAL